MTQPFDQYLRQLQAAYSQGNATEHTYRAALSQLLEAIQPGVLATNEPKREACGAPDYIVTRGQAPLGYLEAKDIGQPLSRLESSEQLKRYRESLGNLILTDYLEFRWYSNGEPRLIARLASEGPNRKLKLEPGGEAALRELLDHFFQSQAPTIRTPKELARRLAALARFIREGTLAALQEEGATGPLHSQLDSFREVLLYPRTGRFLYCTQC